MIKQIPIYLTVKGNHYSSDPFELDRFFGRIWSHFPFIHYLNTPLVSFNHLIDKSFNSHQEYTIATSYLAPARGIEKRANFKKNNLNQENTSRAFRAAEYVNKGTRRPIREFFSDRQYQCHLSPRRRWRCHPRLSVKSLFPVRQLQ